MTKHEAAQAYLREAVNFGPDDSGIRAAEYDAFIAGWEARKKADFDAYYSVKKGIPSTEAPVAYVIQQTLEGVSPTGRAYTDRHPLDMD